MSNLARSIVACTWLLLASTLLASTLSACGSSDDDTASSTSPSNSSNSSSNTPKAGSSGSTAADKSCKQSLAPNTPSILCGECLCEKCEDKAPACDAACWDLLRCMHEKCGADEANLDSCAAGMCSEHAAGLAAAKAIAPCAYAAADRDRAKEQRTSCLIACNYGPIPKTN